MITIMTMMTIRKKTDLEDMGAVGEKVSNDRQAWVPFLCARVVLQMSRIVRMLIMMVTIMMTIYMNVV